MPNPGISKERIEELVHIYITRRGPERSWNAIGKECGYAIGPGFKDVMLKWTAFYGIALPPRRYESMPHMERLAVEYQMSEGDAPATYNSKHQPPPSEDEVPAPRVPPRAFSSGNLPVYESRPDNTYVFGAIGDTHLGSKYERLEELNDMYDRMVLCGADRVFHAGNWIDGYKIGINEHDVHTPHMEGQLRYFAEAYPSRPGLITYAVTGDDHEGWWARSHGIDIGKRAEQTMREHGRTDWVDLGYMEAHVRLVNVNTGSETILVVSHPGGGSAYADSYTVQKIIESLDGGEKPAVALFGHYHKLIFGEYRNVWWAEVGCFQDQTPFARARKLRFAVGGAIIRLEQDPQTGAIVSFSVNMVRYFVRGYYNNRWNKAGNVTLATRTT